MGSYTKPTDWDPVSSVVNPPAESKPSPDDRRRFRTHRAIWRRTEVLSQAQPKTQPPSKLFQDRRESK